MSEELLQSGSAPADFSTQPATPTPDDRIIAWGLSEEYPFESRFLSLEGARYHYLDEGTGPTLLFVHGNPTWSFAWRNLIRGLRTEHRCIAVDHVGCGLSDKPSNYEYRLAQHIANLRRLVEELDLRDITLVAHDWGGAIGAGVAGECPERFQRLVWMNTAAFRSQRIPLRIAACRIPLLGSWGVRGLNLFSRAALRMAVNRAHPLSETVCRGYLAPYDSWAHRIAVDRFVKDIPLQASHPSYAALKKVEENLTRLQDKPVLLPWGMRDWCFSPHFLDEFVQKFPAAQVRRFPEAGHYLFEEQPEELLTEIHNFLHSP